MRKSRRREESVRVAFVLCSMHRKPEILPSGFWTTKERWCCNRPGDAWLGKETALTNHPWLQILPQK